MSELSAPIPAATLILMRPAKSAPEILMMERSGNMAFAAGALVFPGGRVDPDDHATARALGAELADAPARIAAIRETIEETGIAPALRPPADPAAATRLRESIAGGEPFLATLERIGLTLDIDALVPFARWCPNFRETRRFDATFYLAEAPTVPTRHSADQDEAVRTFWASAAAILEELETERAHAIFPTRRNLERLAQFASFEEARADAQAHPVQTVTPWVEEREGRRYVCIPEGIGYPVTAEPFETARRR
jgi:8-oxo-dGTP pyrophosphatase MutT (NUDIX family)